MLLSIKLLDETEGLSTGGIRMNGPFGDDEFNFDLLYLDLKSRAGNILRR